MLTKMDLLKDMVDDLERTVCYKARNMTDERILSEQIRILKESGNPRKQLRIIKKELDLTRDRLVRFESRAEALEQAIKSLGAEPDLDEVIFPRAEYSLPEFYNQAAPEVIGKIQDKDSQ